MTKKIEKKSPRSQHGQGLSVLWLCFLMFVFGYLAASWFDVNHFVSWLSNSFSGHAAAEKNSSKKIETVAVPPIQHPKLEFYTLLTSDSGLHINPSAKLSSTEPATIDMRYKNVPDKSSNLTPVPAPSAPMELAVTAPASGPAPSESSHPVFKQPDPLPRVVSKPTQPAPRPLPVAPRPMPITTADQRQGRYTIQVGSFRSLTEATRMRDKLGAKGYRASITPVMQQSNYWYRVIVGPFSSLGQAQQAQSSLTYREHITGMIRK